MIVSNQLYGVQMLFPTSLLSSLTSMPDGEYSVDKFRASIVANRFVDAFQGCVDVVDFRDAAEDILQAYGVTTNFTIPKSLPRAQACAEALAVILRSTASSESLEFKDYVLQQASLTWLSLTDPSTTLRPRLKTSLADTEALLARVELLAAECTDAHIESWATTVGSRLPIYAIVYSLLNDLDVDETFVNAPKSSIRGSTCVLRDTTTDALVLKSCRKQLPDLKRLVFCTEGSIVLVDNDVIHAVPEPCAHLCVPIPGVDLTIGNALRRYMIVSNKATAAVIAVTYNQGKVTASKKLEIDLGDPADFLDCQRDRDDNIVMLWGTRNVLTGNADKHYVAWTEEELLSKNPQINVLETHKLPPRTSAATKIDFRDHGNLLSLVTTVTETDVNDTRVFSMDQTILFGNHIVERQAPRVYHCFGAPGNFVKATPDGIVYNGQNRPCAVDLKKVTGLCVWFS